MRGTETAYQMCFQTDASFLFDPRSAGAEDVGEGREAEGAKEEEEQEPVFDQGPDPAGLGSSLR